MNLSKIINNKGITLISLVVTIIILILLAGISINLILGQDDIIQRVKETKELQIKAEILQELELQKGETTIDGKGYTDLQKYLYYIKDKEFNGYKITNISAIKEGETGEYAEILINNKYCYTATQINNNVVINSKESIMSGNTVQIPEIGEATYNPTTWTNGDITVTLPTSEKFETRYTIDGSMPTTSSTKYTEPFKVSSNCTVKYIYTDGIKVGKIGSTNIENIDKTSPGLIIKPKLQVDGYHVEISATDNIEVTINTSNNYTTSGTTSASMNLTLTDGNYIIKATDAAGNITQKVLRIKMLLAQNNKFTSTTGGWNRNYWYSAYGDIPNVSYGEQSGFLLMGATPITGYGRLASYYTVNSIPLSLYDVLNVTYSIDSTTTSTVQLKLGLNGTVIASAPASSKNASSWLALKGDISKYTSSNKIVLSASGEENTTISMYIACCGMYSIRDE